MGNFEWDRVEKILDKALQLPVRKRQQYIEYECGSNAALREEVTMLMDSITESEGWLDNPSDYKQAFFDEISEDVERMEAAGSLVGKQVGAYRIREEIGVGGMGSVYLAERADGAFEHRVAIKVIRHGRTTPTNIQRFERERNILAGLNHPGIARLYDGGVTEKGFPYLIMEYVDGQPIDEFCRGAHCTVEKRVQLFMQALQAVRHAHENMIIHRDLKPANMLVTREGKVKILDFGISKILEEDEDDGPDLTLTHARLLTPRYAAPEQILQQPVTTATDLYALGVVFYKLISGAYPFDIDELPLHRAEQVILNQEPVAPSRQVEAGAAKERKSAQKRLKKKLKGDLDAISLKALRKEPEKRYRTADGFLHDLSDYRAGRPVGARGESFGYLFKKYTARHKTNIAVAAGVVLMLIGITAYYTRQLKQESKQARLEAEKARQVSDFLTSLFKANDPELARGHEITAEDLLDRGAEKIDNLQNLSAKAHLLIEIGKAYSELGSRPEALPILDKAIALNRKLYGERSPELAEAIYEKAGARASDNYHDFALPLYKKAVNIWEMRPAESRERLAQAYLDMATSYQKLDKVDSAKIMIDKTLNMKESGTLDRKYVEDARIHMASVLRKEKEYDKAEKIYLDVIDKELQEQPDSLLLSDLYNHLAWTYIEQKKHKEAIPYLEKDLVINEKLRGKGHTLTLRARNDLAGTLGVLGDHKREEALIKKNIDYAIEEYGANHMQACQSTMVYSQVLMHNHHYAKAEPTLKKALGICERAMGKDHVWVYFAGNILAADLYMQGKEEEADRVYHKYYRLLKQAAPRFNRINKRQIGLLIYNYREADGDYSRQIATYQKLIK